MVLIPRAGSGQGRDSEDISDHQGVTSSIISTSAIAAPTERVQTRAEHRHRAGAPTHDTSTTGACGAVLYG